MKADPASHHHVVSYHIDFARACSQSAAFLAPMTATAVLPDIVFAYQGQSVSFVYSLIKGIKERIEAELARLLAASETSSEFQAKDVKWTKLPDYFVEFKDRPCDASFLGGSIAAKLVFTNGGLYVTRSDYDEYGPAVSFLKSG
ncbi:hypothetical protein BASA61_007425 [Batrachochytrium salamandrivorans]|nr:hypothetical protein BASA61_007425 [Batrachochytrium salamandrivorans]